MQAVHCGQVHCIKILEIECPKNDFLCLNACLSLFADNGDVSILVFFLRTRTSFTYMETSM